MTICESSKYWTNFGCGEFYVQDERWDDKKKSKIFLAKEILTKQLLVEYRYRIKEEAFSLPLYIKPSIS